jgi:predicted  nucleic acid-binding Zn-ribbon protein
MSLAKRVFELQQVEAFIHAHVDHLADISRKLDHNEAFQKAQDALSTAESSISALEKEYKDLDSEAEGLRASIKQINDKLYGGKIKNPKELVGFEQEANMLKSNLAGKDDRLLDMMERLESGRKEAASLRQQLQKAGTEWEAEKKVLLVQEDKLKVELAALEQKRAEMSSAIDAATVNLYRGILSRKGQAVVRVEQGRCLGCRVSLSVSELQRVRGEAIVTCSNCGRILYLG